MFLENTLSNTVSKFATQNDQVVLLVS